MKRSDEVKCSFCREDSSTTKMLQGREINNGTTAYICHLCVKIFHARFLKWVISERYRMADEAFAPEQSQLDRPPDSGNDDGHAPSHPP